ncbi:uncharacterized protein LOC131624195 [Vicia villosa]|uniref:uncharacterized protein LOC131624195 n=1 Tax=Vicia villosa TaxID=3911 RepID=UPI00273B120E|nr:uncharacterized protein LOC131624195 [Vicia villosa]
MACDYFDKIQEITIIPTMIFLIKHIGVLQTFQPLRDIQVPKSRANNITWIRVQCHRQRNGIDCGYFILRFMKETLLLDRIEIPSTYFDEFKCAHYSKDQLDELMEECCQFIMELRIL